jgi:hypothetical protein
LDLVPGDPRGPATLMIFLAVALVLCCIVARERDGMGSAGER